MNCQQTKDLMKPFLDGTLDRNTMRRLREHLAACKECASRLDPEDLMEILPVLDESIEPTEQSATNNKSVRNRKRNRDVLAVSFMGIVTV